MALRKKSVKVKAGGREKVNLLSGGLENMTYRDLKRRAISLGMPFPNACAADWGRLTNFVLHTENKPDNSLIDQYDDWVDGILEERGYAKDDPLRNYQLRLGFVGEENVENQKKRTKRVKGLEKPKKPKREKDDLGLWKGTKKSYTFELTNKGYDLERIIRRVTKKFPDAKPKSIQQWHRAALRKMNSGK